MKPLRRLIMLRHGQTDWNVTGRMQGHIDTDLTEAGRSQAKEAARALASRDPVAIVSSDLRRAWDTAVVLAEHCADRMEPVRDRRLRETSLGQWEGLTHIEVDARHPGARDRWRFDATLTPPAGENKIDVARRSLEVVAELIDARTDWVDRPVILVAHGGLIASLAAALLGLSVGGWPALGGLGNASWVELSGWAAPTELPLDSERAQYVSKKVHDVLKTTQWRLDVWNASAKVAPDVL